jgi:hypothetical protein
MWLCDTHVELFDLTYVTNDIEINHLNMTNCDYSVIFYNTTLQKIKIKIKKLSLIMKKNEKRLLMPCFHLLFVVIHINIKIHGIIQLKICNKMTCEKMKNEIEMLYYN